MPTYRVYQQYLGWCYFEVDAATPEEAIAQSENMTADRDYNDERYLPIFEVHVYQDNNETLLVLEQGVPLEGPGE